MIKFVKLKLIYLLKQSPFIKTGLCTSCGKLNSPSETICQNCHKSIKQDFYKICDYCFHKNPAYISKCESCMESLLKVPNSEKPISRPIKKDKIEKFLEKF